MPNIGIDLGTTNSLVAVVMDGKARCLLDDQGRAMVPSAVRYEADRVIVGHDARDHAPTHHDRTFTSVKRFMGRSPSEIAPEAEHFGCRLDPSSDRVARFLLPDRSPVTPLEVSAEILRALRARAAECLLSEPGGAVITVPAYFDDAQRQATRDAARLAGLEVLRLLNEPTAAAMAYGLHGKGTGTFAVYDLGGGTFDVSILQLHDGIFEVLATAGDTHLGGDDLDHALAGAVLANLGVESVEPAEYRGLLADAEACKRALSAASSARLDFRGQEIGISREVLEALAQPLLDRTGEACRLALADAKLRPDDLDAVVLVGGATRMAAVRAYVRELFGREPSCDLDPDEVVALGAAMQADLLSGKSALGEDVLLLDVLPLSLGLEVMGGTAEKFISRCSTIPVSATQTFTTHVDNQDAVDLHVVQGDRELARDNRSLARFALRGLPKLPAGVPRIRVSFTVDANGILGVYAKEEITGIDARIEVQPSYGLTDEEIERMLEAAIDHAESDVAARMDAEARVAAEGILLATEKAIADDAGLLLDGEAGDIAAAMAEVRALLGGTKAGALDAAARRLDEVTAPFAQRRIERDLGRALAGRDANSLGSELGVDASFHAHARGEAEVG